jgi:DNA segregation ATPase FtsK/SpoIIIE, S-DNA-T family
MLGARILRSDGNQGNVAGIMDPLAREWLDYLSDAIEELLASHRLDVMVTGVQVSPRWVRFKLYLAPGTRIASVQNMAEELAMTLGASAIRLTRGAGALMLEMPLPNPQPVHLIALVNDVPMLPPVTAILGLSIEGEPYTLPLMAPQVTHVLIAGATGSGKTELLRSMLLSLALYNRPTHVQLALIDPKRRGLTPLADLPHLMAPIATTPEHAIILLEQVVKEMERRDAEGTSPTPRIIVAVDEVGDLITTGGKAIENALVRLAQRGREAGIHLICSTQRPSAEAVPSALKANLPARLIGRVASGQEALTAGGIPGTNAELLMGSGDFVAIIGAQVTRFQAAYTSLPDIQYILTQLNAAPAQTDEDAYALYDDSSEADWPTP